MKPVINAVFLRTLQPHDETDFVDVIEMCDRSRLKSVAAGTMYSVANIKFIERAIFAFLPSFSSYYHAANGQVAICIHLAIGLIYIFTELKFKSFVVTYVSEMMTTK